MTVAEAGSLPWRALRRGGRRGGVLLSVYYALMSAYRAELMLWAVATALPLIMMGLWVEAGRSGAFALTGVEAARYFLAAFLIRQFTVVWVIYEFEYHVVTGRLSSLLLQPIDPVWRFLSMHVAEWGARLPFGVALMAVAAWMVPEAILGDADTPGAWRPEAWRLLAGAGLVGLAFLVRFFMQYTLAMAGFWQERIHALDLLLELPYFFLAGALFPLDVLFASDLAVMRGVAEFAMYTPFPYMLWLPARLVSGGEVPVAQGFAVLAAWLGVVLAINRLAWRRGLKRYSAMGA